MDYYQKVIALDPEFCKSQVALRIAEVEYKLARALDDGGALLIEGGTGSPLNPVALF